MDDARAAEVKAKLQKGGCYASNVNKSMMRNRPRAAKSGARRASAFDAVEIAQMEKSNAQNALKSDLLTA